MQITKQQVDRVCIFHNDIPKCEFSMHWSITGSPPERLMHKIDLTEGTANSRKYFFIIFDPLHNPATSPANLNHHSPILCTAASSSWNSAAEQAECQVNRILGNN